ncbi:MAG: RNA-directed DNA polymerase [Rickettsiales bacterium]|jgi:retron-type reverse transcriptase|nr:RNA-directed DNA polymerase [Rickettsiales bacterium]
MKAGGALWDEFISPDNFAVALANASRGRLKNPAVARFMKNSDENLEKLRCIVAAGEFRTSDYRTMEITDPKKRTIYILPFCPDRIVHHAIMNILAPIWRREFIRDSYACIPGRGLHAASARAMDFARKSEFVLKCDIRKFYPSISHDIMFEIAGQSVPDARMLEILRDIIYSVPGGRNVPIGNLCSQWLGNLYLHQLDIFVRSILHANRYLRYCDDFLLFADDKAQLREWREKIRDFIARRLGLTFSKCEIARVSDGVDFVGYRHFRDFVLLRKRTMKRIKKKMLAIGKLPEIPPERADEIRGQIAAANGWMRHACSHNMRRRLNFESLKRKAGIKN